MHPLLPHEYINLNPNEKDIELTILNLVSKSLKENLIKSNSLLTIKKLTDGLSNIVFAVHSSKNNGVIVRIYGRNSDLIVDRQDEIRLMIHLAKFHMSPSIVLTFNNGFIYQYIPGTPISNGDEEKALLIARKLAEFHSVPLLDKKGKGQLVEKLRHYVNLLSGVNDELYKRIDVSSVSFLNHISWSKINDDINKIEQTLNDKNSKWKHLSIVVCHNDTQNLNFLYENKNRKISLIDFEYCGRNMWLYDVVNYFMNYFGCEEEEEPDYDKSYLKRDKQKQWLEVYLSNALFLNNRMEKQMTLDELCDLGDCLRAPIHLYWTLWAFLEALINLESMEDFNYIKYGKCRLKQYEKCKNDFFLSAKK